MNHEMAETDQQKAEMLNTYFLSQTKVKDTYKALPTLEPVQHTLETITITMQDVFDVLKHLDLSKACDPDLISQRLLRECADFLAYPYSIVLIGPSLKATFQLSQCIKAKTNSKRRFVLCLILCHIVLVFFSPFSIAITSLGEERADLSIFRTFVLFVLVWSCRFPLPLGVWEGLRFVIVALPGLSSYLFFSYFVEGHQPLSSS